MARVKLNNIWGNNDSAIVNSKIGRGVVPIFMYVVVIGYQHPSNRKKHMIHLLAKKQSKYVIDLIIWQVVAFSLSVLFVEILDINLTSNAAIDYQFFGSVDGDTLANIKGTVEVSKAVK